MSKLFKTFISILVSLVILVLVGSFFYYKKTTTDTVNSILGKFQKNSTITTQTLVVDSIKIDSIKNIAEMVYAEIPYQDYLPIDVSNYVKVKNPIKRVLLKFKKQDTTVREYDRILYIYKCVYKLGINAKNISSEDVSINHEEKKIALTLPSVEILSHGEPQYERIVVHHSEYVDSTKAEDITKIYDDIQKKADKTILEQFTVSTEENIREMFMNFFKMIYPDYTSEVTFK